MKTKSEKSEARQVVPIRFRRDELALLKRAAKRKQNTPYTTLAREIVVAAVTRSEKRARA